MRSENIVGGYGRICRDAACCVRQYPDIASYVATLNYSVPPEVCMRRIVLLFICLISLPAFAQSKHPFTFEDMMKLKRVAEPVPSPDGKWVLFSVTDVDLTANTRTPHIWVVPLSTDSVGTVASPSKDHVGTGASPVRAEQ